MTKNISYKHKLFQDLARGFLKQISIMQGGTAAKTFAEWVSIEIVGRKLNIEDIINNHLTCPESIV